MNSLTHDDMSHDRHHPHPNPTGFIYNPGPSYAHPGMQSWAEQQEVYQNYSLEYQMPRGPEEMMFAAESFEHGGMVNSIQSFQPAQGAAVEYYSPLTFPYTSQGSIPDWVIDPQLTDPSSITSFEQSLDSSSGGENGPNGSSSHANASPPQFGPYHLSPLQLSPSELALPQSLPWQLSQESSKAGSPGSSNHADNEASPQPVPVAKKSGKKRSHEEDEEAAESEQSPPNSAALPRKKAKARRQRTFPPPVVDPTTGKRAYNVLLKGIPGYDYKMPDGPIPYYFTAVEIIALLPHWFKNKPVALRFFNNGISFPVHLKIVEAHRDHDDTHKFNRNSIGVGYRDAIRGKDWRQNKKKGIVGDEYSQWESKKHTVPSNWNHNLPTINGFTSNSKGKGNQHQQPDAVPLESLTRGVYQLPQGEDAGDLTRAIEWARANPPAEGHEWMFPDDLPTILQLAGPMQWTQEHTDSAAFARYRNNNVASSSGSDGPKTKRRRV